jgi:ElaB/YqjD/DUF883 family membrane-anchored ribosome-binding protein
MDTNVETNPLGGENVTREKLVSDLKTVAQDAESLLKETAGDLGEKAQEARARLSVALQRAKETCCKVQEKAIAGAKAADKCVREHPYPAIGIAFGVGVLIGLLIKRR